MIGQTLDHYRVLGQIGEGGMGVVYRARDQVLNRDVALKLLAHGAVDKVSPSHLLREAQTASSLSHPNICTIHQVGETGNDFYVVMELIEGRSLSDLITATGLSMELVTRYGTQIADALAHAHDRGIVHRDLKGSNVMVTPEGRVKAKRSHQLAFQGGSCVPAMTSAEFGPILWRRALGFIATRLDREEIGELTRKELLKAAGEAARAGSPRSPRSRCSRETVEMSALQNRALNLLDFTEEHLAN